MSNQPAKNPYTYMQKATILYRSKRAITLKEINEILPYAKDIQKLDDKGLFIYINAQLINQYFSTFLKRIEAFNVKISTLPKPIRKRRDNGEDQDQRPRRARKPRNNKAGRNDAQQINLQDISNEIISHPSNAIKPIQGQLRLPNKSDKESQKVSNDSSKTILEPNNGIPIESFADQVSRMEGQILQQTQQMNLNGNGEDSQTSSSSASNRYGVIQNLSQKLRILGGDASFEAEKKTRKTRANISSNVATRKKSNLVVDDQIDLQEGRTIAMNERLDFSIEASRDKFARYEQKRQGELFTNKVTQIYDKFEPIIKNKQILRLFKPKAQKTKEQYNPEVTHVTGNSYEDNLEAYYETSMPKNSHSQSNFEQTIFTEGLLSNIFIDQQEQTLNGIGKKVNKPRWEVFQNLLWGCQQGEVILTQKYPEKFGEIVVERVDKK